MKFLRTKTTCLFLAFLMLFASCNQYDDSAPFENNSTDMVYNKSYKKGDRLLTDQEIEQIGIDHNFNLDLLFANNPSSVKEVNQRAYSLYKDKGVTEKLLEDYAKDSDSINTDFLIGIIDFSKEDFIDSDLLKTKISEIKIINKVVDLQAHETATRKLLTGIDLDTYLVTSTVYRYSLSYWEQHYPNATESQRSNWKEADGIAASIGFLTMAASVAAISTIGIATGGTGVIATIGIIANLLEIGVGAALSSIYTFF